MTESTVTRNYNAESLANMVKAITGLTNGLYLVKLTAESPEVKDKDNKVTSEHVDFSLKVVNTVKVDDKAFDGLVNLIGRGHRGANVLYKEIAPLTPGGIAADKWLNERFGASWRAKYAESTALDNVYIVLKIEDKAYYGGLDNVKTPQTGLYMTIKDFLTRVVSIEKYFSCVVHTSQTLQGEKIESTITTVSEPDFTL